MRHEIVQEVILNILLQTALQIISVHSLAFMLDTSCLVFYSSFLMADDNIISKPLLAMTH